MVIVDQQIPNQGRCDESREGQYVRDSVDVLVCFGEGNLGQDAFCWGVQPAAVSQIFSTKERLKPTCEDLNPSGHLETSKQTTSCVGRGLGLLSLESDRLGLLCPGCGQSEPGDIHVMLDSIPYRWPSQV